MIKRRPLPDLLAPLAYALLAALALQQPLIHAGTHLTTFPAPGVTTDFYHFHWNFWWIGHALANGLNVYETNAVFAPATSSLALHTLSAAWYPVWWLGNALGGTVGGMNAVFFAALLLTAWAVYLLLRTTGAAPGFAFVGGAAVGFSALMRASIGWTNINLMAGFWLPILLLTWRQIVRAGSTRAALAWGAALGAAAWAMLLTDLQYPLLFAPVIVPYGLWLLLRAHGRRVRALSALVVAGGLAAALLFAGGTAGAILSYDRTGGAPTPADRATDIKFPACVVSTCADGAGISIVVIPVAIAAGAWVLARRRRIPRRAWGWLALAPLPLLLALGDSITIFGVSIPMPYPLLHNALGGLFRYPERFLPALATPALAFTGLALTARTRGRPRLRAGLAIGLFGLWLADSRVLAPLALQPIPTEYAFYDAIAADPFDYVVLEVPTGGSSGEGYVGRPQYSALQWYGIVHGKRMVNGHLSRVNTYSYFYMNTDDPMMAWLGQRRFLEPEPVAASLRERISTWPIGAIVVHRDLIAPDQHGIDEISAFLNSQRGLVCPLLTEGAAVVYRTNWHPDGCPPLALPTAPDGAALLDIGASADALIIGPGWHFPEPLFDLTVRWMGAEPASVIVDVPPADYTLTVRGQAYEAERVLTLAVNGQPVGEPIAVAPSGLAEYTFAIPRSAVGSGAGVVLTLSADGALPAPGTPPRDLSVMVEGMRLAGE